MGLLDLFRRRAVSTTGPQAATFNGFTDPAFLEYVRSGSASVTIEGALRNSTVLRCVDLISGAIGSLPLIMQRKDSVGELRPATDHPLHNLFLYRPNPFQTAFEFKQVMQARLLAKGNAFGRIVMTGNRVSSILPITGPVEVVENWDGTLTYRVQQRQNATQLTLQQEEVFHLRSLSLDGVEGLSRVELAAGIINTALAAQVAAERIFQQGVISGGWLKHKGKLSLEAQKNLQAQVEQNMAGTANAGKWRVLEEGMEAESIGATAEQSQLAETSAAQVEEIGRVFGVPRPLLFVDDTSWGSGIEQLAILFVRFGLAPWFKCWEDAIIRSLLTPAEWGKILPDFDERELLRGTLKDQGDFFAKASGAGGHRPWMETNEIRALSGLGPHKDGFGLMPAGGNQNVAS
jgi:HK97 family phage portal protein